MNWSDVECAAFLARAGYSCAQWLALDMGAKRAAVAAYVGAVPNLDALVYYADGFCLAGGAIVVPYVYGYGYAYPGYGYGWGAWRGHGHRGGPRHIGSGGHHNAHGYRNAGARYPATSSAWSGDIMSCWWQSTAANGAVQLCATQGRTLIRQLQTVVGVTPDGDFGPATFDALIGYATTTLGASADFLAQLQADYNRFVSNGATIPSMRGTPVAYPTQVAIIWAAVHSDLPFASINVPRTIQTVHFGQTAPSDGGAAGAITCVPMSEVTGQPGAQTGGGAAAATGAPASSTSPALFVGAFMLLALAASGPTRRKGK